MRSSLEEKVIRDGMGQSPLALDADCLDLIITNATIIDPLSGVIKAGVGIKEGRISGVGHGETPLIQDGVDPSMVVGAGTEVIAGEGMILTAGGMIPIFILFVRNRSRKPSQAA